MFFDLSTSTLFKPFNISSQKNKSFYIDGNGKINDAFKARNYSNWEIEYGGKKYIANDFEVTEFTDNIEVQLQELTE